MNNLLTYFTFVCFCTFTTGEVWGFSRFIICTELLDESAQEVIHIQPATSKRETIAFIAHIYICLTLHEDSQDFPSMQVNAEGLAAARTSLTPGYASVVININN